MNKKPVRVTKTGLAVFNVKGMGWRWRWIAEDYVVLAESPLGVYYPGKLIAKKAFRAFLGSLPARELWDTWC